ncbi:unnamed protein product [Musa hybrid cultivar]
MAGPEQDDGCGGEFERDRQTHASSSFVWDDGSKLYYHASSGFYHDPSAGWYYSSRDGLYYTFEDGRYIPLPCDEKGKETHALENARCDSPWTTQDKASGVEENPTADGMVCPSSEWLEETLIDLYLSGCSNRNAHADVSSTCLQTDDASSEEKNWQAQYGQVVRSDDEGMPCFPVVDLWDWEMVTKPVKKSNIVSKLIGRTVRCSNKLHPSVSAGGLVKTAAIDAVHLDLVHVASGKVYRLRSPNRRYLASISTFDSSNPTKDWGFPDLYANFQSVVFHTLDPKCQSYLANEVIGEVSSSMIDKVPNTLEKHQNFTYKDRAAARRTLHGDFSIGPGQKDTENRSFDEASSPSRYSSAEDAAAEAINMSFGSGSYARRILENMGWNDGEGLGNSRKGILEPLHAVGNKGCAGLGWSDSLRHAS